MNDYSDILEMEYNGVRHHPHLPPSVRAAIMAPFAALTGFDEEIDDTAHRKEIDVDNELTFEDLYSEFEGRSIDE